MKVLIYHPFGNQNVYGVIGGLAANGFRTAYHTSLAFSKSSLAAKVLRLFHAKEILRKEIPDFPHCRIHNHPLLDTLRRARHLRYFGINVTPGQVNICLNKIIAKRLNSRNTDVVYAFTNGAENLFCAAAQNGIARIYDMPIAYYKEVLAQVEAERMVHDEWVGENTLYTNSEGTYMIDRELGLADVVIAASSYTKNSLVDHGCPEAKIKVVPYGFPTAKPKTYRKVEGKLRLLYVGGLSQMKGFSYMIEAVERLSAQVTLSIIGGGNPTPPIREALKRHNYLGTMPHDEVLAEMQKADILLFPTLTDGFGMVVSEAMSQGTPVIASDHSCATDIIADGENGWIVPARSSEAIVQKLRSILDYPRSIEQCGRNASQTAAQRTWADYGNDIAAIVSSQIVN